MKILIAISVVGALAMWTSAAPPRVEPAAAATQVCDREVRPGPTSESRLPPCSQFQGVSCNGSTHPRCLLAPGEPAVCVCVSGFFECS